MKALAILYGRQEKCMVNLNKLICELKNKHEIEDNSFEINFTNFLVSNNWFGEDPVIENKAINVSDEFLSSHSTQIESFFAMYKESPENKSQILMQKLESEFPETAKYYKAYRKQIGIETVSSYSIVDFLCYNLPGELAFSSDNEIQYLLEDATASLKRTDAVTLCGFINWMLGRKDIKTAYHNAYEVNNYSNHKKDSEAVGTEFYLHLLYYLFSPDFIEKEHMYQKAADDKRYADAWLYMAIHFICALRYTDLARFPHPELPYEPATVLEMIRENTFTATDAKKVLLSVTVYLNAVRLTPNKTKGYSGISSIQFHIPYDCEEHFGKLFAIAEAHFQIAGKAPEEPLIVRISEYRDIKKIMGSQIGELFLTLNFHGRQMNKAFLQVIERMTMNVAGKNGDFNTKGYVLASLARSHKQTYGEFAHQTATYLKDQKMGGYTAEFVAYELFERGVLSNILSLLLKMVTDGKYDTLPMQQQTEAIKALNITPWEAEQTVSFMQDAEKQAEETALEIFNSTDKQMIIDILHRIGNDNAPSKTKGSQCILIAMCKVCPYIGRSSCIGCKYEISTRSTVLIMANEILSLQKQWKNTDSLMEKERLKTLAAKVIAPKLNELLLCLKETYGDSEYEAMQNLIKEIKNNEKTQTNRKYDSDNSGS